MNALSLGVLCGFIRAHTVLFNVGYSVKISERVTESSMRRADNSVSWTLIGERSLLYVRGSQLYDLHSDKSVSLAT